jgi:hypothetical protein
MENKKPFLAALVFRLFNIAALLALLMHICPHLFGLCRVVGNNQGWQN